VYVLNKINKHLVKDLLVVNFKVQQRFYLIQFLGNEGVIYSLNLVKYSALLR